MKARRLPNPESEPEMAAHMASAKRTARLFIGRRLRCRSSGDGLHGPYDFDLDHRTATCRACRREVNAFDFMLGLEVDAACWRDDFNRHRIVAAPAPAVRSRKRGRS